MFSGPCTNGAIRSSGLPGAGRAGNGFFTRSRATSRRSASHVMYSSDPRNVRARPGFCFTQFRNSVASRWRTSSAACFVSAAIHAGWSTRIPVSSESCKAPQSKVRPTSCQSPGSSSFSPPWIVRRAEAYSSCTCIHSLHSWSTSELKAWTSIVTLMMRKVSSDASAARRSASSTPWRSRRTAASAWTTVAASAKSSVQSAACTRAWRHSSKGRSTRSKPCHTASCVPSWW